MYIALKPCTISGAKYLVNDVVDTSALTAAEVAALIKRKQIAGNDEGVAPVASLDSTLIAIPVLGAEENFAVALSDEQIIEVFSIMQTTADDAIKAIGEMTDENVLILIHACDNRKTVKKAAEDRAKELNAGEGDE